MAFALLSDDSIRVHEHAADWVEAVRLAGSALESAGIATAEYSDEMVRMIEEHGPYVVISPGLALAHARPGPAVLADGLAIVTLAEPVAFGHAHNDPVSVVLGLAVASRDAHIQLIAELANAFNDPGVVQRMAAATDAAEVRRVLEERS